MKIIHGAATSVGLKRVNNEDSYFVEPLSGGGLIAGVFDGMGGHDRGEEVSKFVADCCQTFMRQSPRNSSKWLSKLLLQAHIEVCRKFGEGFRAPGTTAVVAMIVERRLMWSWLGDSRLYITDDKILKQLTKDHSSGWGITGCIGGGWHGDDVPSDEGALLGSPSMLLCTDGVSNQIADNDLNTLVRSSMTPQERADAIVKASDAAGGRDNATAVVIQVSS